MSSFEYETADGTRFRGNAFYQRGSVSIALRLIPKKISTIAELHLPEILTTFARKSQGFFIVVGPVGQGKTTTLAAMIELINTERMEHIVTIEDPIEYIYEPKLSLIEQREVRIDTKDFPTALKEINPRTIGQLEFGQLFAGHSLSIRKKPARVRLTYLFICVLIVVALPIVT